MIELEDSNHEDNQVVPDILFDKPTSNKFEPLIFFVEHAIIPSTEDGFLLDVDSPYSDETIHGAPHHEMVIDPIIYY